MTVAIRDPHGAERLMIGSACLIYLVLSVALSATNLPLCDEGFYGVPAEILSTTGHLRNPVMEPAGFPYLRGIDREFYWTVPLGVVLQAGAFKAFGFKLLVQRGLSVAAGLGVVLLWYSALRRLIDSRIAALAALFLSIDYVFQPLASRGRSDVLSLFFALAALAAYMNWRERLRTLALAASNTACALSGLIHPNGGLAALAALSILMIWLDGWPGARQLAVVAAAYAIPATLWAIFIAQARDLFVAQFLGNIANRMVGQTHFSHLATGEIVRLVSAYQLNPTHAFTLVRVLLPVSYLTAILLCVASKDLRRQCGPLLLMLAGVWLTLITSEGSKQGWYLIHLSPLFAAFLAISVTHLWNSMKNLQRLAALCQASAMMLGVASLVYSASSRHLERLYQPAVAFLNSHASAYDRIFARSEFYFALRCRECLRDDPNLGALSHLSGAYIVLDPDYETYLAGLAAAQPSLYTSIERDLFTNYREVFRNANYRILHRAQ